MLHFGTSILPQKELFEFEFIIACRIPTVMLFLSEMER